MRRLRHVLRACGAGLFIAVAAPAALAASDQAPPSSSPKAGAASHAHHSGNAKHPHHAGKPAPHKATTYQEHKKDLAVRPTNAGHAGSADKSSEQRPLFGPFSLGVETDPKVKRRSIRGGEYDPDRDGDQTKGFRPSFLGLSLKSQFSW
jgi:hypothetical protein